MVYTEIHKDQPYIIVLGQAWGMAGQVSKTIYVIESRKGYSLRCTKPRAKNYDAVKPNGDVIYYEKGKRIGTDPLSL